MEKRLILALILSILILSIWTIMFPQPKERQLAPPALKQPPPATEESPFKSQPIAAQKDITLRTGEQSMQTGGQVGQDIIFDTALYRAVFSTKGGALTSFQLKKYPEEKIRLENIDRAILSSRDEELKDRLNLLKELLPKTDGAEMVSTLSYINVKFPLSIYWQEGLELNYNNYEIDKGERELVFSLHNDNLDVIKKYIFRDDTYLVDIEITLINKGKEQFSASPLVIQYGPGLGLSTDPFGKGEPYHRCLVLIKEAGREKVVRELFRHSKRGSAVVRSYPDAVWGGLENKYFMAVFLPPAEPHSIVLEKDSYGQLNAGLKMQMPELSPGGKLTKSFSLYLGPKQEQTLMAVGKYLEKGIDYGAIANSLKIMNILRFFYRITQNWGAAIIILTIIAKIVFLPFTQKGLRSMEKMQKLQPQLKDMRLKYKDDPRRMYKELMELYRREGVNPMGGCLPMLCQMPIFIALFTTLRNTIDLRGANFLWIRDLSLSDTVYYIGNIPLNPLPLLMGITMFWQQKMTATDPEHAKAMMFMPLMFTVMLYNFSAGLVLYWLIQNILTIAHQYAMRGYYKKHNG